MKTRKMENDIFNAKQVATIIQTGMIVMMKRDEK
jgi:hypothetical protein